MREVRGRRPVPRAHWLALVVVLFTITVALGLHGYVSGELTDAGHVRPPGPAGQLPESIRDGGPILGPRAGAVTSIAVPGRTVVLTFDDGPDPTWTPKVLQVLRRHEVPGTFFLLGSQMLRHPELVRQELAEGHEVGNHSFTHPDLTTLPVWEQRWQLAQAQLALVGIAGRTTALLRPPYVFSADSLDDRYWSLTQDAHANGYVTVLADVDARDWERPGVDAIVQNATPKNGQGAVILLHDSGGNRAQTVEALDVLIPKLKSEGYRFTTIAEVARVPAYHPSSPGEQWRGQALVWATKASQWIASFFAVLLLVAGVLTVARMVLMLAVARRHGRTRRRSSWGQPVSSPVSVVVPAYNEKEGIEPAVRSLLASDHPVEVVVVDDGSTDGTGDLVAGLDLPGVTLVRQENAGKPAALNAGIRAARHDLIVLVDGDTRFEPDTVRALVQPFADPARRRGLRQREGGQPPRAARPLAAHRVRHGLQPGPPPLRRVPVHAHGSGRGRCLPPHDAGRRRWCQRRHAGGGHRPDGGRRPSRVEGGVRGGCSRVDRSAVDLGRRCGSSATGGATARSRRCGSTGGPSSRAEPAAASVVGASS